MFDEVLKLRDVGFAEPFHKPWDGIMCDSILGHNHNRRFPQVADLDRALSAENFSANIVSVNAVASQIDHSERTVFKSKIHDGVVNVADLVDFGISENTASG